MGCCESTAAHNPKSTKLQYHEQESSQGNILRYKKYHQADLLCMSRVSPTKNTILTSADDNVRIQLLSSIDYCVI